MVHHPRFGVERAPLAALPGDSRSIERHRLEIDLFRPVGVEPGALRGLVNRLTREALGTFDVVGEDGARLLRITSRRARARIERWADPALFPAVVERVRGITPLQDPPDVEAYLGGWG
ncbi:hypothetical protein GCM10025867_31220 [Frondihabitans sucicola]|uniref:Uncharacterized protein n=1 Tax=Frondihabitans sucicola TaxID=1268041 RepID=A0ABN6Y4J9_9MICO|nr:hypothetical protein [Frondihabitans sucicola]BDZ50881.1 hypothetical protein GCM10025867_31220 [Frondihabitans sucicola]